MHKAKFCKVSPSIPCRCGESAPDLHRIINFSSNMRFAIHILSVLFFFGMLNAVSAQEITKKRGKHKIYFPSGKVHSQGKVKNYHRNGEWKYYDEEGHLISIAHFVMDTIHGAYTDFFTDGKVSLQGTYCKNQKCGNWKMYDSNGHLISDENYAGGQQEGVQRYWYPGGRLRDSILFVNGFMQQRHSWYFSGSLKTIETYVNGLPEGRWTVYPEMRVDTFAQTVDDYHNGKRHGWHYQWNGASLIEAYHYADGLPDGTFTRYEYDGKPLFVQHYSKGARQGLTTYYKGGAVVKEENYRDDAKHGLQTEYGRNGKPSVYEWYSADERLDSTHSLFPNGKLAIRQVYSTPEVSAYTEWDSAGVLLMKGTLHNEARHGEWTTYYPNGKVRSTTNYEDGRMLGLYTKYYPNGKKMIQYTFLSVGTNTPPDAWNQQGKILKPGTKAYDEIVEGNKPGEIFSDPSEFNRPIIRHLIDEHGRYIGEDHPDFMGKMEVDDAMALADQNPVNDSDEVFVFCEVMPEFPGGEAGMQNFIKQNLQLPQDWNGETAYVEFIVEKDGRVTNVKAVKNPESSFSKEVVRVVSMFPVMSPGVMNGRVVRCKMIRPIRVTPQ